MPKKKSFHPKMQVWIDARKRHHLSHAHVQMARELGLNPKKLGKMDNHDQEPWKLPLGQYIEHLYFKNFHKERPGVVLSIENKIRSQKEKRLESVRQNCNTGRSRRRIKSNSSRVPHE